MAEQQTAATVELPNNLETLINMGYEKADREYMLPEDVDGMSETQLREFLTKPKEDATPEPKQDVQPEPQQPVKTDNAPAPVNEPEAPPQDKAPEEHPDVKKYREMYDNLHSLYGKQTGELGQLRQQMAQYQPYLDNLQDPRFQQHVLGFYGFGQQAPVQQQIQGQQMPPGLPDNYDPYNPAHVQQMINNQVQMAIQEDRRKQAEMTQRAQVTNMMQTFQKNLFGEQQRLIAGGADPVKVNTAVQAMSKMLMDGTFVEAAVKYHDMQNLIAEAEARGRSTAQTEFQKQIQEASQTPVRTAGAGARQSGNDNAAAQGAEPKTPQECETPDQLMALISRMRPGSGNWLAAAEYGASKGWPQFMMGGGGKDYRG